MKRRYSGAREAFLLTLWPSPVLSSPYPPVLQEGWQALRPVLEPATEALAPAAAALQRAAQPRAEQLLGVLDARLAAFRPWQVALLAAVLALLAARVLRGVRRLARAWQDKGGYQPARMLLSCHLGVQ